MSIHEASIILNVAESTVRRWFHAGRISGDQDRATGVITLHRSSVDKLLR